MQLTKLNNPHKKKKNKNVSFEFEKVKRKVAPERSKVKMQKIGFLPNLLKQSFVISHKIYFLCIHVNLERVPKLCFMFQLSPLFIVSLTEVFQLKNVRISRIAVTPHFWYCYFSIMNTLQTFSIYPTATKNNLGCLECLKLTFFNLGFIQILPIRKKT